MVYTIWYISLGPWYIPVQSGIYQHATFQMASASERTCTNGAQQRSTTGGGSPAPLSAYPSRPAMHPRLRSRCFAPPRTPEPRKLRGLRAGLPGAQLAGIGRGPQDRRSIVTGLSPGRWPGTADRVLLLTVT